MGKVKILLEDMSNVVESSESYEIIERKSGNLYKVKIQTEKEKYNLLQPLIEDDNLEEIMVVGVNVPVYVYHRKYGMCETNLSFKDSGAIEKIIKNIAEECGRRISTTKPLIETRLPDGSRMNAVLGSISLQGPTITIRKFKAEPLTIIDLIKFGTCDVKVAAFLWLAVEGLGLKSSNILISGGSGCGKTTTLNCLGIFIPANERVITIEDPIELQLPVKHKISLEARPPDIDGTEITMDLLLKNALRMRPDRIIMGEMRGREAETFFTAMNTGHDGCMSTIHANSARETITRLTNPPMSVLPIMIPSLDLIIMQNIFVHKTKGTIRRITEIAEVGGVEGDKILLNNIYEWDSKADSLNPTGTPSILKQELAKRSGLSGEKMNIELEKREVVLNYLVKNGITKLEKVYEWIQDFYTDQKAVFDKMQESMSI